MALMERLSIFITFVLMHMGRFFVSSVITDVRLFNGPASNKGTIEIREDWGWETTCGSVLVIEDVMVICRQLGFPGASRAINNTPYADGYEHSLSTLGLDCRGDESRLSQCPLSQSSPCTPGAASCYGMGYIGCFKAEAYFPVFSGNFLLNQVMTISLCIRHCAESVLSEHTYAGVKNGNECSCGLAGDDYARLGTGSDEDCQTPCLGDPTESCGGLNYAAVFTTNGQPLPVASTDASNYIPLTKPSPCHDSTAWTTAILIVGIILALAVLYGNIIITLMYLNHRRSKYALKGKDDGNVLPELEPMHDDVK